MLTGKDFLLLELQKTGSSHIRKLLVETPRLNLRMEGMHNGFESWQKKYPGEKPRLIAASIRNPWDWYVSLWAYGCRGKGGLYQHLASTAPRDILRKLKHLKSLRRKWQAVYHPAAAPEQFRLWLHYMLEAYPGEVPEGYGSWPLRGTVGFMTFRFLQIYSADFSRCKEQWPDKEALASFAARATQPNYWLHNEQLSEDTAQLARKLGAREDHIEVVWKLNTKPTNAGQRAPYQHYYDEACRKLVAERESWIIEKFNYAF